MPQEVLYICCIHQPDRRFESNIMVDLYRKERRRKRLQEKNEHTAYPYKGKAKKPRREAYRRSQDPTTEESH